MNAVGIDVSKGKSMVAALRPMGEVAILPHEVPHTGAALETLGYDIIRLGEDTRVVMEATGRYHEPVAQALHELGITFHLLSQTGVKKSSRGGLFLLPCTPL